MLFQADEVLGIDVVSMNGEDIGKIEDLIFDDREWRVRYLVVDVGSLFAEDHVLISPESARQLDFEDGALTVELTRQQVEESPPIDLGEPLTQQRLVELHSYYGWGDVPVYGAVAPPGAGGTGTGEATSAAGTPAVGWFGVPVLGGWGDATRDSDERKGEEILRRRAPEDPNAVSLHGMDEVLGYRIRATDKLIGAVGDWLIDEDWFIRYLIVDTRRWLPSRDVLVPVAAVSDIDPFNSDVHVDLSSDAIRESPEFDPDTDEPMDRAWEERVFSHYGLNEYWRKR
jgi:sporulation protein YlmC with PRC-barrel domain